MGQPCEFQVLDAEAAGADAHQELGAREFLPPNLGPNAFFKPALTVHTSAERARGDPDLSDCEMAVPEPALELGLFWEDGAFEGTVDPVEVGPVGGPGLE
jgi:hypothetical protein